MIRVGLVPVVAVLSLSPAQAEQPMTAKDMAVAHKCAMPRMKGDARCKSFKQMHAEALAAMPEMSRDGPDLHSDAQVAVARPVTTTP